MPMFVIARINRQNGFESDWLVDLSPASGQIEVTRTRQNARKFKAAHDAKRVRDLVAGIAVDEIWEVIEF